MKGIRNLMHITKEELRNIFNALRELKNCDKARIDETEFVDNTLMKLCIKNCTYEDFKSCNTTLNDDDYERFIALARYSIFLDRLFFSKVAQFFAKQAHVQLSNRRLLNKDRKITENIEKDDFLYYYIDETYNKLAKEYNEEECSVYKVCNCCVNKILLTSKVCEYCENDKFLELYNQFKLDNGL